MKLVKSQMESGKYETGFQLFARLEGRCNLTTLEPIIFPDGPKPRDVIEFYGSEGTGKTQMLLHLIAKSILPDKWKDINLNGLGIGVVFIDTDYHFSILRLFSVLESKVADAIQLKKGNHCESKEDSCEVTILPTEEEIEFFLKDCLKKFFILRCSSSMQLVLTLHSLEPLLTSKPDTSLLIIDSVSAFYWIDRMNGGDATSLQESNQRLIVEILQKLINAFKLVLIVTKPAVFQKRHKSKEEEEDLHSTNWFSSGNDNADQIPEHWEYMCKDWQMLVTQRFVFSRKQVKKNVAAQSENLIYSVSLVDKNTPKFTKRFEIVDCGIRFI